MKMECLNLSNFKKYFVLIISAFVCSSFVACSAQTETQIQKENEPASTSKIVFFETENDADCELIIADNLCVMIDAGEKKDGKDISKQLQEMGITKLDYLILSHFDKDHCGGALKLLKNISVGEIIQPSYVKDSEETEKLFELIREKNIETTIVDKKEVLELSGVKLSLIPAKKQNYSEKQSNNSSLVVKAEVEEVKALFTGDCQEERIDELLASNEDYSADILKLMYHGRAIKNEEKLIEKINPSYTVVTAKDSKKTRKNVEALNLGDVFFNQNGNIVFEISDSNITVCEY